MQPRKYQGYAQGSGFNPINIPDESARIARQGEQTLRGMERAQRQGEQNQANYMSALDRVGNQEDRNRDMIFNLDKQNRRRVFEDEMRNMERQTIDPRMPGPAAQTARDLERLAVFSNTLGELAVGFAKERQEKAFEEGKQLQYMYGVPLATLMEYEQNEEALYRSNDALTSVAMRLQQGGAPQEVVDKIRGLSGAKRHGFFTAMVQRAGQNYGGWLLNEFQTNTTTKIRDKEGNEFTPSEAFTDPVKAAVAMAELRKNFYKINGFNEVNDALLNKYAFPDMLDADARIIGGIRKQYSITQSEESTQDTLQRFLVDKNLSRALNEVSVSVDENGSPRGMRGAWQVMQRYLQDNFDAGLLSEDDLTSIENQIEPVSGQKFGERWKTRFMLLREQAAAENRKNFSEEEQEREILFKEAEQASMNFFNEKQPTIADIEAVQAELFKKYGRQSEKLNTLASTYSIDAQAKDRLDKQFTNLAEQGLLTPEMVSRAPWSVQQKWAQVAKQQADASSSNGEYKLQLKAIENHVKSTPRVKVSPDGATSGLATLVVGDLQATFRRKVAEYVGAGMPAGQAAQQAVAEVMQEFSQGTEVPGSKYFLNQIGEFSNIVPKGTATTSKALVNKLNRIRSKLSGGGRASLNKTPGLIFDRAELQEIEEGYGEPGWRIPPVAQYWSNVLNISPLEIINRQRRAAGMPDLATPQEIEQIRGTISPGLQGLLNRFPSVNRSIRALSSTRAFNPSSIPSGYGPVILQAAQANNIHPGILAGLLEVESGFRSNAVSRAGATGIAQIMPQYHPGVNPRDPVASINYAAKLISGYQRQFGGDMRLALLAYNGGAPTIAKYRGPIPGNRENQAYYGKVIKAAAKYGYGDAWRDPSTMRGKFRVIEYLTGDRSHSGYDRAHGGNNYHEHIAFASKAERDAAIRKLTSAGIKVGSIDRPGDPGNHGKGLAIDIPASQVPVGKEEELSRRVRSILGIS